MQGDREFMLNFFQELDYKIHEKYNDIQISATILGGCFFVLHSLRENSPDIDLLINDSSSYRIISEIGIPLAKEKGITLDLMYGNTLEKINLPDNYMRYVKPLKRERNKRKHLKLWTLSPYHILISKISRYSDKDKNDIKLIMNSGKFLIRRKELERAVKNFKANEIKSIFEKNYNDFLQKYEKKLVLSWWEKLGLHKPIPELKDS
ncbi:MAG: DUF6036 family nucleotidyltransferase [Nanoarchaeota archaeon]|nr:DUF6036 family nucleotidyltransferase [Nanoarchaeota archaeon]